MYLSQITNFLRKRIGLNFIPHTLFLLFEISRELQQNQ
jgi:hypothetical protein